MKKFALVCALFSFGAILMGCGGGGGGGGTPTLPQAASLPSSCTTATVGSGYSCQIAVTGGKAPFTWMVSGLPTGLSYSVSTDTTTLTISGAPHAQHAVASAATPKSEAANSTTSANVSITITDKKGRTASLSFTINITSTTSGALTISTTTLASGTAGSSYSATIAASGGTTPYSWTITGLPSGITPTSATPSASISGTTDSVGTFNVSVMVTDAASATASTTLTLTIAQAGALVISTGTLPNGTVNVAYSQTLAASGGVAPYAWSTTSGSLPTGLTLSSGGMISGTPTAAATSTFTVQASDSESPAQTKSVSLSITIGTTAAACALSGKQLAFEITGSDSTGFAAMIGSVKVATDTSLSGALDFRNQSAVSANQSISGAAGSCADASVANTGSFTFTAGGITRTIDYAMRTDGTRGFVLESDSSGFKGSGEIQVQTAPTAGLGGSYAFGLEGATTTAYFYVAGAACTNSSGGITFLQADFSVSGTLFPAVTGASSNAGTFSAPDSNGRVTTTSPISYSNGTTVDTTGYLIDGTKAYVLDTGGSFPGGSIPVEVGILSGKSGSTCLPLGQGASFTNASFGNSVFSAHGVSSCSGCAVTVGSFIGVVNNFNSSAGTASLTDDGLSNGVGGELDSGSPLTYSVSSVGRVSVMNTNTSGKISTSWVYLDGTGNGYLMVGDSKGRGIALGVVQPQTATTVGPGTFAFGTELLTPATSPTFYPVTEVTFTATTLTDLASGGSTGSYTCDSVGRCTAPSLGNNVTFGDSSIVFYVGGNTDSPTSSNFILVLQTTAANADGGTLIQ